MKGKYQLFALILLMIFTPIFRLFAQAPEGFTYQAEARDSRGRLIVNADLTVNASILEKSAEGPSVWFKSYTVKTDKYGLFTIIIGDVDKDDEDFLSIVWDNGKFFLSVQIVYGTATIQMPVTQLLSVPYALYAKSAGSAAITETDPTVPAWAKNASKPDYTFGEITSKPTTLSGYGIVDAMSTSHIANSILSTDIDKWNTCYNWGNHSGLYKPLSYLPSWVEITGNPFSISSPSNNQLLKYNESSSKWENWTPDFITGFTESDPIFSGWNKSEGIAIIASQVSDFQSSVENNTAVAANTAKISNATHSGDVTGSEALTIANKVTMTATLPVSVTGNPAVIATNPVSISIAAATTSSAGSLSASDKMKLDATSGTNTGDETSSTIKTKLGIETLSGSNTGDQNLASVLINGNSAGSKTISDLSDPVNPQDAATRAYVDALIRPLIKAGVIVADADGNIYPAVRIGTQVWMAENLKTTKYNDGEAIPQVTADASWQILTAPGYCWYNNNQSTGDTYGAMYNWYTVKTNKLCPVGWHVPSDAEWTTLTTFLGDLDVAGGKMKEAGTTHWYTPNKGATNESGFSGLPGGARYNDGAFYTITIQGHWWSSTESDATEAWCRSLYYNFTNVFKLDYLYNFGFSVRCIKDN